MSKKKSEMMTVNLPDGRKMQVPKGLMGSKLQNYVQTKLAEEQAAAALAEAKRQEEASELFSTRMELSELRQQMAEQSQLINELRQQNEKLQTASPDAAAGAMALMSATRDAERLRRELMTDLGAASEWRSAFSEDIREVAAEVRKKNAVVDHEARQNQLRARLFMDDLRSQQGLERLHPELLEQQQQQENDD